MSARQKLIITETEPTPIVKDFMTFAAYAEKNEILLTKTQGWLPRKVLQSINALMTEPEPEVTAYSDQNAYPLLALFHNLALAAKLFRTEPHPSGKQRLLPTERLPLFYSLNPTEKYISLLEAFWVDADWSAMTMNNYRNGPSIEVRMVFEYLENLPPGNTIDVSSGAGKQLANLLWRWGYFVHYFRYFGFWETTKDKEASMRFLSKFAYPLKTLTPSPLFYKLCTELNRSRDFEIWNLSLRREAGDWRGVPGEPLWEDEDEDEDADADADEWVEEDFAQSLVHLFPAGELTQWLPRQTGEFFDGTYILQVAVRRNCWRRIRISSHSTLYDLHEAIQQAFDFDDDHLYAFFLDGKIWSTKRAFYSPDADDRPVVTEACLGELELSIGQTFLYLFDFGDEWEFVVTVEDAGPIDSSQLQPQVIESEGAAPQQYGDYY
ncbi:plasmid pRiA4b ORF-3 family protein [Paenibacillaceae bacterium WGS1546]|uniref:plasmid pRiA4b ORF-3 family protein n=1 Tax=Cohnella sp. WGS1546 TaxID=3366810 RepID=UPI00372D5954